MERFGSAADIVDLVAGNQGGGGYIPGPVTGASTGEFDRSPLIDNQLAGVKSTDVYRTARKAELLRGYIPAW